VTKAPFRSVLEWPSVVALRIQDAPDAQQNQYFSGVSKMIDGSSDQTGNPPSRIDKPLFAITGGFILLFCAYALFDLAGLSAMVDSAFAVSARYLGLYWQLLLMATFLIGLLLCVLPGSKTLMGGVSTPEFKTFSWGAMIMCTLLAGGGVFWAAGEPIALCTTRFHADCWRHH